MNPVRPQTRREVIGSLTFGAMAANRCQGAATPDRPNILFIYTDDHSYRTVSAYPEAYSWVRTPDIDGWPSKACGSQRRTLAPGACPRERDCSRDATVRCRVHADGGPYPGCVYDPQKAPFWPKVFRAHGYFTAQIGKWHTGTDTGFGRDWDFQLRLEPSEVHRNQHALLLRPAHHVSRRQDGNPETLLHRPVHGLGGRSDRRQRPRPKETLVLVAVLWGCARPLHSGRPPSGGVCEGIDVATPADIFPPRSGKPEWAQKVSHWEEGPDGTADVQGAFADLLGASVSPGRKRNRRRGEAGSAGAGRDGPRGRTR